MGTFTERISSSVSASFARLRPQIAWALALGSSLAIRPKANPYAGLKGKPLWPTPENPWPESLVNPSGARTGLIGNLGLSPQDEQNLVAFLTTLSDAPPPGQ